MSFDWNTTFMTEPELDSRSNLIKTKIDQQTQAIINGIENTYYSSFLKLPAEIRLFIYQYYFSDVNISIHRHNQDCVLHCGDRRIDYYNLDLLLTCKTINNEAKLVRLNTAIFHIHRVAFHNKQTLPALPHNVTHIRQLVLWGDVGYRVTTDPNWYNRMRSLFPRLDGMRINFDWGAQQQRMSWGTRKFIHTSHSFAWELELRKVGRYGDTQLIVHIDELKNVTIAVDYRVAEEKIVKFLTRLELSTSNVTQPLRYI